MKYSITVDKLQTLVNRALPHFCQRSGETESMWGEKGDLG